MAQPVHIVIAGGGAAGFFAAIHAKAARPNARVTILEKTGKLLSKVLISGGGRCNVTFNETDPILFLQNYPRGRSLLKWPLRKWSVLNTVRWFEANGVELKTEEDGRMFPVTNDSRTVAGALLNTAEKLGVEILLHCGLVEITPLHAENGQTSYQLLLSNSDTVVADKLIITTGGFPKIEQFTFIRKLGIEIVDPVPSLFTFNISDVQLHSLKGISTPWGRIKVQGYEGWYEGPVLITHWGLSGPAVLKTSAFLARELAQCAYHFKVFCDWTGMAEEPAREHMTSHLLMHAGKNIGNANPFSFPKRLWEYLLRNSGIEPSKNCRELSKSEKNKLLECCVRSEYQVKGKTTFKEEFVTAGGVSATEIDPNTMCSKKYPHLYFAGEVLDADGITGGFNFQAAWATGYVAGSSAARI